MTPRTPGREIAERTAPNLVQSPWTHEAVTRLASEIDAACENAGLEVHENWKRAVREGCILKLGDSPCGDCALCRLVQRVRCAAWKDNEAIQKARDEREVRGRGGESEEGMRRPVNIGGVYRCCLDTLERKEPKEQEELCRGTVVACDYCKTGGMVWNGEQWEAKWIFEEGTR
jgi:hypothetical protein